MWLPKTISLFWKILTHCVLQTLDSKYVKEAFNDSNASESLTLKVSSSVISSRDENLKKDKNYEFYLQDFFKE